MLVMLVASSITVILTVLPVLVSPVAGFSASM
jgi:hypothetical protein